MGDASEPRARGNLAHTPFAHLVLYLYREGVTGTLCIEHRGIELKLFAREGRIVAAKPIERGLSLQEGLIELCALEQAPYTFWDEDLLEGATGAVRGTVDPHTFVTESLRKHTRDEVVDGVLGRYRGMTFQLAPGVDLKRLGLRRREVSLVETLASRPCDEATLIERATLSAVEVRRLLYMLVLHKHVRVETSGPAGAPGAGQAVSISPGWEAPRRPSTAGSARGPSGATRGSVPPSARPPAAAGSPRPGASIPAWQQLASRRVASRSNMPAPRVPSVAPPPAEALDAAGKIRRAEQLCERKAFESALRIANDLVAQDDRVADHHALRAWIHYQTWPGGKLSRPLADAVTHALELDDENVRALFVKGLILKRTGKKREAQRYFARVVALDPRHLDAQRELRLARMREKK